MIDGILIIHKIKQMLNKTNAMLAILLLMVSFTITACDKNNEEPMPTNTESVDTTSVSEVAPSN